MNKSFSRKEFDRTKFSVGYVLIFNCTIDRTMGVLSKK